MRRCRADPRLMPAAAAFLAAAGVGWCQAQLEGPANRGGPLVMLATIVFPIPVDLIRQSGGRAKAQTVD